jgi:hypothetical protein
VYPMQSKTVLVDLGDLGLRGWQRLDGFLVFRVVRVDDLDQVLLSTTAGCRALPAAVSLLLLLPLPTQSPAAPTPQDSGLCHIEKYLAALLVCYRWFRCVLDSGSRPVVLPQLSEHLGRLVRWAMMTSLAPLPKPTLVLSPIQPWYHQSIHHRRCRKVLGGSVARIPLTCSE